MSTQLVFGAPVYMEGQLNEKGGRFCTLHFCLLCLSMECWMVYWLTHPTVLMNCSSILSPAVKSGNTEGSWWHRKLDTVPCFQVSTCSIICLNRSYTDPNST
jgi:hypothetical protein